VEKYITIGFSSEIGYFGSFSGHSAHEGRYNRLAADYLKKISVWKF